MRTPPLCADSWGYVVHGVVGVADGDLVVWVGAECSPYGGVGVGGHEFSSLLVVALLPADHETVDDAADVLHVNTDEELHVLF